MLGLVIWFALRASARTWCGRVGVSEDMYGRVSQELEALFNEFVDRKSGEVDEKDASDRISDRLVLHNLSDILRMILSSQRTIISLGSLTLKSWYVSGTLASCSL